jgi:hypothetical protein
MQNIRCSGSQSHSSKIFLHDARAKTQVQLMRSFCQEALSQAGRAPVKLSHAP